MTRSIFTFFLFSILIFPAPADAFACACCAEPGTYSIWTGRPETFHVDLLKEIEFDKHAFLYMTEAGFDSIKGLSMIEKEFDEDSWTASPGGLDLVNTFTGKVWTFRIRSPKGRIATITLPIPQQMVAFKVDIHDDEGRGNGPLLYKEFRFKGTVSSGTGFLSGIVMTPTTYFLVFQGRGNGCDDVSDFRNWNLEVTGKKARFQFFGKLGKEAAEDRNAKNVSVPKPLLTLQ